MYFFDLGICYLLRASIIDFELFGGIFLGSKEFLLSYSIFTWFFENFRIFYVVLLSGSCYLLIANFIVFPFFLFGISLAYE